jgi:phosphatidylserine/phosphatidylglycerophosphate/cardiolipin synthase-like enzyme
MAYEPEFMKSFSNKEELNRVLIELIDCSIKAILILLPRPQSFNPITEKNIFRALRSAMLRNVEIRIIMASKIAHGTIHQRRIEKLNKNISIRYLHRTIPNSQLSLIIDYKFTLSIEENDKDKSSSRKKEIQLAHYSNIDSKAMVSSSIFENYWMKAH